MAENRDYPSSNGGVITKTSDMIRYELKIMSRKLRTYAVCGALVFHFFDTNPFRKYEGMVNSNAIPYIPNYIINETSSFIISYASIWVMFLVADIMLKEKDLKMKEILSVKPVKKLNIFLGKFSACFVSINVMIGLIFLMVAAGEVYIGDSPHLGIYVRNFILDVLPMMFFSVSTVTLLSVIFRNTKITYIFYFIFRLLDVFFPSFPLEISKLFRTCYSNSYFFSISLTHHIFLKIELLLISLAFLVFAYVLYSTYFLKERGGFS